MKSTRAYLRWTLICSLALLWTGVAAAADNLTGTVTNATTGKPAAGDEVVLLTLSQGMNESAHAKTDAEGKFSLPVDDPGVPHLVRVTHDGVNYFPAGGPTRPGASTTSIKVYDAVSKLDGVKANVQIMRVQAPDANTLQVIELIAVRNDSKPARTLAGDRTWPIELPAAAQIDQADAQGPGGMPVNAMPAADDKQKGRYYFEFPLRPGETRFQIAYHTAYAGEATFEPHVSAGLQHFAVLMPKTMQFGPRTEGVYSPMADDTGQSNLQVATNITAGKDLAFRVSGTGVLPDAQSGQSQSAPTGGTTAQSGPGGGLGTPEGTPDPLSSYRVPLLITLVAVLGFGGLVIMRQRTNATASARPAASENAGVAPAGNILLQALKDELFELEMDRLQHRISNDEYVKAKAALDQTLKRAIARAQSMRA